MVKRRDVMLRCMMVVFMLSWIGVCVKLVDVEEAVWGWKERISDNGIFHKDFKEHVYILIYIKTGKLSSSSYS